MSISTVDCGFGYNSGLSVSSLGSKMKFQDENNRRQRV